MTRVHIRTDDEVYRVDAVWLGPPRATFPWRARYSAYGVGLIVMLVVMFLQRRLGIDLGFFSVAWALLITVAVTRFVSRRIDDERPLLEWLTLFAHELRGPRMRTRGTGGALTTGHVTVRRDRPRALGPVTAVALPRGTGAPADGDPVIRPRVRADEVRIDDRTDNRTDDAAWGPPPEDARRRPDPRRTRAATPTAGPAAIPAARRAPTYGDVGPEARRARRRAPVDAAAHLTPGLDDAGPSHAPRTPRRRPRREGDVRATPAPVDGGFGPPSSADVVPGGRGARASVDPDRPYRPASLPPGTPTPSAADEVASWSARREPVRPRPVDDRFRPPRPGGA